MAEPLRGAASTLVAHPQRRNFNNELFVGCQAIQYIATIYVKPFYRYICLRPLDLQHVRCCLNCGSMCFGTPSHSHCTSVMDASHLLTRALLRTTSSARPLPIVWFEPTLFTSSRRQRGCFSFIKILWVGRTRRLGDSRRRSRRARGRIEGNEWPM